MMQKKSYLIFIKKQFKGENGNGELLVIIYIQQKLIAA